MVQLVNILNLIIPIFIILFSLFLSFKEKRIFLEYNNTIDGNLMNFKNNDKREVMYQIYKLKKRLFITSLILGFIIPNLIFIIVGFINVENFNPLYPIVFALILMLYSILYNVIKYGSSGVKYTIYRIELEKQGIKLKDLEKEFNTRYNFEK